jgi:hypothetical protein
MSLHESKPESPSDTPEAEKFKELAWSVMICSVFRQSEKTTLNLIVTLVGIHNEAEANALIHHIFRLVRKGIIYVPEAQLDVFKETPERVDVYLMKDYNETMQNLSQELRELRIELDGRKAAYHIPKKVLIDLKNFAAGKYVGTIH